VAGLVAKGGYMNKIARVNLTKREVDEAPGEGRGRTSRSQGPADEKAVER